MSVESLYDMNEYEVNLVYTVLKLVVDNKSIIDRLDIPDYGKQETLDGAKVLKGRLEPIITMYEGQPTEVNLCVECYKGDTRNKELVTCNPTAFSYKVVGSSVNVVECESFKSLNSEYGRSYKQEKGEIL